MATFVFFVFFSRKNDIFWNAKIGIKKLHVVESVLFIILQERFVLFHICIEKKMMNFAASSEEIVFDSVLNNYSQCFILITPENETVVSEIKSL